MYQPGSSIPTKINKSESCNKHVGILTFTQSDFGLETHQLIFQRPTVIEDLDFKDIQQANLDDSNMFQPVDMILNFVKKKFQFQKNLNSNEKPYIRFKLNIDKSIVVSRIALEKFFIDFVANPKLFK